MQGCLVFPQRLSLKSLTGLQSCRTFGTRSVGSCSFLHCRTNLDLEGPGTSKSAVRTTCRWTRPGVANDLPLQGTVTVKGLAFGGNTEDTSMRSSSFAIAPSCSYQTEVTGRSFNWTIANSGKSCASLERSLCGISKPLQTSTTVQWRSRRTQHRVKTWDCPGLRVASETGGQEVHVKEEEFEFKRITYESDSITTFYSSDISSSDSDCEVEEENEKIGGQEKKAKAPVAYAGDSGSNSDCDGEKGTDHKKLKLFQQTDNSNKELNGLAKYGDVTRRREETVENGEDSDSDSEDEQEKFSLSTEEKLAAQANLKLNEKLEKDSLKATKKVEKKQKKEEKKKLNASKKYDEESAREYDGDKKMKVDCRAKSKEKSIDDGVGGEEGGHNSLVKTIAETNLKFKEDLNSDSEDEEDDDGVTDFGAETLQEDKENFVIMDDEVASLGIENDVADEIEEELDDVIDEDDDFWEDEEGDVVVGDGGTGGGIVLGGLEWGMKALDLAEQVLTECGEDLSIFAFKACPDGVIRIRLDKLSDRYGSPSMTDIEAFSNKLSTALEDNGETGALPKDMVVEVSSPGAERVVRVPDDLERFKELPMYVLYSEGEPELTEKDGVLELDSLDMEAGVSVWKIANVKLNREVKGRGRPLNSKQKKWRATVPFTSLKQVRLYVDM